MSEDSRSSSLILPCFFLSLDNEEQGLGPTSSWREVKTKKVDSTESPKVWSCSMTRAPLDEVGARSRRGETQSVGLPGSIGAFLLSLLAYKIPLALF
jgi:hypothetical protein